MNELQGVATMLLLLPPTKSQTILSAMAVCFQIQVHISSIALLVCTLVAKSCKAIS